jgi:hypothetical protein
VLLLPSNTNVPSLLAQHSLRAFSLRARFSVGDGDVTLGAGSLCTPQARMRTLFRFRKKAKVGACPWRIHHLRRKTTAAQRPPVLNAIVLFVAVRLCQLIT